MASKLQVLDLFSGTGGWSRAFSDRGHQVLRIDNESKYLAVPGTFMADVRQLSLEGMYFDVVLASPPCQAFSLAAGGKHLRNGREPITEFGKMSVQLVEATLRVIKELMPPFWWIENPNGGMVNFIPDVVPRTQVTWCQYGESRMKLTNLWGRWPHTWIPRPRCKNGDPCHEAAPRGAKTGTQGIKGAEARGVIPYALSEEVCIAVEDERETDA